MKKFTKGVVSEDYPAEIHESYLNTYNHSDRRACKHCYDFQDELHTCSDGTTYRMRQWKVPRVLLMRNQGGYDCTIVCIDCLLGVLGA